jgi:sulfur carrier protein ThiS adenylyltransferase
MSPLIDSLKKKLGTEYIEKARSVKIGIAGCGGLGGNCAFNLVRSGIMRIKLVDFDLVEPENLDRQFFFQGQAGMAKPCALADNLKKINPAIELDLVKKRISRENAKEIFKDCRIIVEALDQAEEKAMIVESLLAESDLIVSVSGISGLGDSDRIMTHRLKKNLIVVGDFSTGTDKAPPLSPMVNIAAAKQADAVIEHIMRR